jgi:hypothetical protein
MTFYNFLLAILWCVSSFTLFFLIAMLWHSFKKEDDKEGTGLFAFLIAECVFVYVWAFYTYQPLNILIYLMLAGISGIVYAHKLVGWKFGKFNFK